MKFYKPSVQLLHLIFTSLVCYSESQVPVTVALNTTVIDHVQSNLYMQCDYDFTDFGSNLGYLRWTDEQQRDIYIYDPNDEGIVIHPDYNGSLTDWENISNKSHSIVIVDVNWCNAGTFTCFVSDDIFPGFPNTGSENDKLVAISTDPEISYSEVDGSRNMNDDTFPPGTSLEIKCSASWNKNFSVSLSQGSSILSTSYGEKEDDTCTHQATTVKTIMLNMTQTYVCTANYDDEIKRAEITLNITRGEIDDQCGGLCGGEIAGIVIGSIAFLAIVGLLIWYCYKKRGNKALEPEKNKRDENKKNPKNNQVGDSQEDLGQDKRNKGDVNYHENPSYSSQ